MLSAHPFLQGRSCLRASSGRPGKFFQDLSCNFATQMPGNPHESEPHTGAHIQWFWGEGGNECL